MSGQWARRLPKRKGRLERGDRQHCNLPRWGLWGKRERAQESARRGPCLCPAFPWLYCDPKPLPRFSMSPVTHSAWIPVVGPLQDGRKILKYQERHPIHKATLFLEYFREKKILELFFIRVLWPISSAALMKLTVTTLGGSRQVHSDLITPQVEGCGASPAMGSLLAC